MVKYYSQAVSVYYQCSSLSFSTLVRSVLFSSLEFLSFPHLVKTFLTIEAVSLFSAESPFIVG